MTGAAPDSPTIRLSANLQGDANHLANRDSVLHSPRKTIDFDSSAFRRRQRPGEVLAVELEGTVRISALPDESAHLPRVSSRSAAKRCQTAKPRAAGLPAAQLAAVLLGPTGRSRLRQRRDRFPRLQGMRLHSA